MAVRVAPLLAVLLVASVMPGGSQAQAPATIPFEFPGPASVEVNAITQADRVVAFTYHETTSMPGFPARAAYVTLSTASQSLDVDLGLQGDDWVGTLPVSEPELVLATWQVRLFAIDAQGVQHQVSPTGTSAPRTLVVGGTDTAPPAISFPGAVQGVVTVGPDDTVRVNVTDQLLRQVTYRVPGLPRDFRLNAPFEMDASNFLEGKNNLTIRALDRAGKQTVADVSVIVDSQAPQVTIDRPAAAQVGLPVSLTVRVKETTEYEVRLQQGASTQSQLGASTAGRDHTFTFTPNATGNLSYRVTVRDVLGNVFSNTSALPVVLPAIDVEATNLRANGRLVVGTPSEFLVELRQTAPAGFALAPRVLSLEVSFAGHPFPAIQATLPVTGNVSKPFSMNLSAGVHTITVSAAQLANATDPDLGNNVVSLSAEVFLAKVTAGNRTFYVRGGSNGQPTDAVDDAGSYALSLVDHGISSAYAFEVQGKTLLYVPGQATAVDPADSTSGSDGPAKDSPSLALPLLALALVALALVRRR